MDDKLLAHTLWPDGGGPEGTQAYAVLDGARNERIAPMVRDSGLPHACLYAGALLPALAAAAPYLVQLAPESRFFRQLVTASWGQGWGIYAMAPPDVSLQAFRSHWRSLLRVQDPQGRVLVFRFYDPRVLRVYLPTCSPTERERFLGPARALICESEADDALVWHEGAQPS